VHEGKIGGARERGYAFGLARRVSI
jgi:hypothetical protein